MGIEVDNLFKALDILMDERLKKVSFDTTEICVIVDASNSKNGKYKVSPNNGETKYDAYSESDEYTLGETVRVSIPNGDFSQKKFIEGKYVVDESISPITYISPLYSVVDVTGNMLSETKYNTTFGLIANGPRMQIPIWSADLAQDESYQDMQANGIYNTIALTADFKTLMGNLDIRSGSYGLRLDVYVKLNPKSTKYILRSVYLDSSEMFGDPYNFMLESTQSKTFDLSSLGMVDKMTLYFYQNNDFSYYDRASQQILAVDYDEDVSTDNLLLSNVVVSFGSDLSVINDNTLAIYSKDNLFYNSTVDPATNEKEIGILWYNKTEDNQYVGFGDGLVDYQVDDDGNIIYKQHVDKDGNPVMVDAVDSDGKIIYIPKLDDEGKQITTTATVDGAVIEIPVMEPQQVQKTSPVIKHYDEIQYLVNADESNRLSAYLGKEGVPSDKDALKLAADIADVKILFTNLYNYISRDLMRNLRDYKARIPNVSQVTSLIDTLMKNPDTEATALNNLQAVFNLMTDARDKLYTLYDNYLNYCYKKQNDLSVNYDTKRQELLSLYNSGEIESEEEYQLRLDKINKEAKPDEMVEKWLGIIPDDEEYHKDYFDMICKYIEESGEDYTCVYDLINNFITSAGEAIDEYAQGCRGTHDTYKIRLTKVLQNIKDILKNESEDDTAPDIEKEATEIMVGNYDLMKEYYNRAEYVEYVPDDFSDCANRYSIYWYRYEPGYVDLSDRFKQTDWRRLTTKLDFGLAKENDEDANEEVYNFGLPVDDTFIEKEGKIYWSNKAFVSTHLLTRLMSMSMEQEKYQVILFYNHEMYQSDEIVFTNLDPVVNEQTADATAALSIQHGENSQEVFQSYDISNYLKNSADYNTVRTLKAHYEGELGGNEHLIGGQIYWYIPNSSTMLWTDAEYLSSLGFYNDISGTVDEKFYMDGYHCYYKEIGVELVDVCDADGKPTGVTKTTAKSTDLQFYYKIKNYFLQTSTRNSIICKVYINQEKYKYEANTLIKFNTFGTSGTDYTLAVYPITTQIAVYDSIEQPLELDISLFDYNNKVIPIGGASADVTSKNAYGFTQSWFGPTTFQAENITVRQDEAGNIAGYSITKPTSLDKYYGVLDTQVTCPINMGTTAGTSNEDGSVTTKDIILTAYHPLPYSLGDYYIEGATMVVYGSGGNNPAYYKDPYRIFSSNSNQDLSTIMLDGEQSDVPRYDIKWKIKYYKMGSGNSPTLIEENTKEYAICRNSMPIIENNCLKPCNMYVGDENGNPFCYCSVECHVADKQQFRYANGNVKPASKWIYDIYWIQPIVIVQNRYPSAMLNSWDGGLTIDEKNGTILSTMVGAGRKTRHNTFEGVLMGDIGTGADIDLVGNKSDLGIYGFHDGAQSFGFNIDGTGFIGKAGRGRINFDGNSGTIASASRTQTHNSNGRPDDSATGIIMDLDDGYIDMLGGQTYTATGIEWQDLCVAQYKLKLAQCVEKNIITQEVYDEILAYAIKSNIELATAIREKREELARQGKAEPFSGYSDFVIENSSVYHALAAAQLALMNETLSMDQYNQFLMELSYTQAQCDALFNNDEITLEQYNKLLLKEDFIENDMYDIYVYGSANIADAESALGRSCGGHGHLYRTILIEELQDKLDEYGTPLYDNEGNPIQETVYVPTQSHIRLDVQSPHFFVVSDQGKRLINIGDNTAFNINTYNVEREPKPFNGSGYYLKTNDYIPSTLRYHREEGGYFSGTKGSGMLLDLAGNKIDAYNFSLKGEDSSNDYYGSYLKLTSDPNSFVDIYVYDHDLGDDEDKPTYHGNHVLKISDSDYELRSFDWYESDTVRQGMLIDLSDGTVEAYSNAHANCNMKLDAGAATYPLVIGTVGSEQFKIGWDGSITTPNFSVDAQGKLSATEGTIGGWLITSDGLSTPADGTMSSYLGSTGKDFTICGSSRTGIIFKAGSGFGVSSTGALYSNSGYIGGWEIGDNTLSSDNIKITATSGTVKAALTGGTGTSTWAINNDGTVDFTAGTIGGWNITQTSLKSTIPTGKTSASIELAKGGTIYIRNNGTLRLEDGSDFVMVKGGSFNMYGGAFNLTSSEGNGVIMNIQSGSTVNVKKGCSFNVEKEAQLTIAYGGEFSFNGGTFKIGGPYFKNNEYSYVYVDGYIGITQDIAVMRTLYDGYNINVKYGIIVGVGDFKIDNTSSGGGSF